MLFMIIEHFKDVAATGERFRAKGRMLPEGVTYQASWVEHHFPLDIYEDNAACRFALILKHDSVRR